MLRRDRARVRTSDWVGSMRPFFRSGQASPQDRTRGTDMASVSIAKPSEVGLADWMSHLRDWLNRHGIEPAGFRYQPGFPRWIGPVGLKAAKTLAKLPI